MSDRRIVIFERELAIAHKRIEWQQKIMESQQETILVQARMVAAIERERAINVTGSAEPITEWPDDD